MTLTGTLKNGARVERIPTCECEGSPANSPTQWDCGEPAIYRVTYSWSPPVPRRNSGDSSTLAPEKNANEMGLPRPQRR
jgi:hypothetical protein